ncbi:ROK family protein [Butyrivibrio sp. NC3005]|uniref:ROK family protein n=1 Tax=Butyrivibrio sp. NC3005 TaxID=1280685 RepID=UPI0004230652|nr:ROK family protein [Butyrivibrio sp. NC3005]
MNKYAYGIDVGGTAIKYGFFDNNGVMIRKWQTPTNVEDNGTYILNEISNELSLDMKKNNVKKDEIAGAGLGIPGPVNKNGIVQEAVNLGWKMIDAQNILQNLIGIKVKICNDANAASLGENWMGAGKGCKDMIMVTLGTGIGGGIICNGKIVNGTKGYAGEIGHIHINDFETDKCGCGNTGCFEQYASATGLMKIYQKVTHEYGIKMDNAQKESCETVFKKASSDVCAQKALEIWGEYLGKGLSIIVNILNPECIVIGGGVSKAGSIILDLLEPSFTKNVLIDLHDTSIKLATLGNDAGIYGAARNILKDREA